ncbi:MAG: PqqD family protein [Deltaproteobacteria bacterium]
MKKEDRFRPTDDEHEGERPFYLLWCSLSPIINDKTQGIISSPKKGVTMSNLLRKNPDIKWKEVDGEIVLLNPKTGGCFGLQAVGASFWGMVDGNRSLEDILLALLDEYDVEETTLTRDIHALLAEMRERGLIFMD